MTSPLDPELLQLVREACDLRSERVLVALSKSGGAAAFAHPAKRSATTAEKLEEHLVAVFRHELADLYWHVGERLCRTAPATAPFLNPNNRPRRHRDLFEPAPWKARAERVLGLHFPDGREFTPHLERLTRLVLGGPVPLVEIARAGFSLIPLAPYRFHEAFGHEADGNFDAAKAVLGSVLEDRYAPFDRAAAAQNLGHLASLEGDDRGTIEHYREAAEGNPWNIDAASFWLELTLWYELPSETPLAMTRTEEAAERNPSAYSTYLQRRRSTLLGLPGPLPKIPATVRRAASPHALRLLNLLTAPTES